MLPILLEEIPRPAQKCQKKFLDHIHRWRCFLFQQWKRARPMNVSNEILGQSVDRLIGMMLLLEHCKRNGYFDIALFQFSDVWRCGTLDDLQHSVIDAISCPILKKVFASDRNATVLPSSFLKSRYEERIRSSLEILLQDHPVPLWLFGDYHQLCVANPHGKYEGRKRSSQIRHARGIHYTPAPIVDYLTATVLDNQSLTYFPYILDPSCGCGSFLIAAFRYLVNKTSQNTIAANREQMILDIMGQSLFGIDVDSQAIDWTIRLLYLESKRLIGVNKKLITSLSVPDISCHLLTKSFFDVDDQTFDSRINTVIGGPPFVCYRELKRSQPELVKQLRERFLSIKTGQFDLYIPFIEHAVNLLQSGNKIGFSLSNSFLRTDAGQGVRHFIRDNCSPTEVLEFSGSSIYLDAKVQIALLSLTIGKDARIQKRHVSLTAEKDIRIPLETVFVSSSLSSAIGLITSLNERELIPRTIGTSHFISNGTFEGIPFHTLPVDFFQGAISKSDEIFMFRDCGTNFRGIQHGLTRYKEKVCCEKELAIPIIRGREIKGFRYSPVKYFYLVPYIDGRLIPWAIMQAKYPLTFQYLNQFNKFKTQKEIQKWFSYHVAPVCNSGDVIVSCRIVAPRSFARLDLSDKMIHGSAFGIKIRDRQMEICPLLLYLNSRHFWTQLEASMPPMGIGHRAIRMSIFKKLLIPKTIAYPTAEDICIAHHLEKRICQAVGKGVSKEITDVFAELDSFVDCCISK